MKTKWIGILFVMAAGGLAVQAQDVRFRSRAQIDSLLNPPLMEGAGQVLRFDSVVRHIGTLTEDDAPVTREFTCTNVSGKPVELALVRTTCGCMTADYRQGTIEAGGSCKILLTYHPKNHPGTADSNAFVYLSGSDKKPVARLTLLGNVLPGADEWERFPFFMGKLRLKRKSVEMKFGSGGKAVERILCGNSGGETLRLSAQLIPDYAAFRTEPEAIPPGGQADIVITVDKALLPQGEEGGFTFPIVVGGIGGRPSDRTINVKVSPFGSR